MGLTSTSLSNPESIDYRRSQTFLSESGRPLFLKDHFSQGLGQRTGAFRGLWGQPDIDQFLKSLPVTLQPCLSFSYMSLVLQKDAGNERAWYVLDGQDRSTLLATHLIPSEEQILSWVTDCQETAVIADVAKEIRFSNAKRLCKERPLKSVCAVPLSTAHRQLGAILIGSAESDASSPEYVEFFSAIADQIAMAVDNALSHAELRRHEALSRLSKTLASCAPEELSGNLAAFLHPLLDFDFLDLLVFKEGTSEVLWHSVGAGQLPPPDVPIEETTCWWVHQKQQPLCIADWKRDDRFAARREALKKLGFEYRYLCRVPLRAAHHRLGMLSVASARPHDYSEEEARFLSQVADQVSLAVAHALQLQRSRGAQTELEVKSARLKLLLELADNLASTQDLSAVLRQATVGARRLMRSDLALLALLDSENGRFYVNAFDLTEDALLDEKALDSLGEMMGALVLASGKPRIGNADDFAPINEQADAKSVRSGFRETCVLPLMSRDQIFGILALSKREDSAYTTDEVDFLMQVSTQLAIAIENALVHGELPKSKNTLVGERLYPENETHTELKFAEIVGKSAALRNVLEQIEIVAPTDSGVLIQGETGTGKELVARAIHNLSARSAQPFVKVNCAAIPSGLLESELFGHEKGAFTGAVMRKAGRFEVADKGTLFLDEVGDIPLELQPKLLRVLQEHEFERLGSTRTQQVDVRVIAATHRDLRQMVEDGQFRSDLFYRLHVFPLSVPALRDRREDIPLLVRHYVDKCARRLNRRIETIPSRAMEVLASYAWPGNVRELQNFIERAVILSPGAVLRPPLAELKNALQEPNSRLSTLEEAEREHVLRALRESNWVIAGPNGAAARLGMKRTTLAYRIRKLKIACRPQ
jgi:formate hydrogenlyase transcriptional activator